MKTSHLLCLEVFHHRCVRCALGITQHQQWTGYITNDMLLRQFEMTVHVGLRSILLERHIRWLGHTLIM